MEIVSSMYHLHGELANDVFVRIKDLTRGEEISRTWMKSAAYLIRCTPRAKTLRKSKQRMQPNQQSFVVHHQDLSYRICPFPILNEMEGQFKKETEDDSLCFETSGDELASLSLIEKYDRYLQRDTSEVDSDTDFFPDDTILKEEYAQLRIETAKHARTKSINSCLSTGIPGKFRKSVNSNISVVDDDEPSNVSSELTEDREQPNRDDLCPIERLNHLIEDLATIRKCEPDGNSIFCEKDEWHTIQVKYGAILDLFYDLSSCFESTTNSKSIEDHQSRDRDGDDDNDEDVEVIKKEPDGFTHPNNNEEKDEDMKLLAKKMDSVQEARDKFYEVEQQVREQLDQLELVERYKMESVG